MNDPDRGKSPSPEEVSEVDPEIRRRQLMIQAMTAPPVKQVADVSQALNLVISKQAVFYSLFCIVHDRGAMAQGLHPTCYQIGHYTTQGAAWNALIKDFNHRRAEYPVAFCLEPLAARLEPDKVFVDNGILTFMWFWHERLNNGHYALDDNNVPIGASWDNWPSPADYTGIGLVG